MAHTAGVYLDFSVSLVGMLTAGYGWLYASKACIYDTACMQAQAQAGMHTYRQSSVLTGSSLGK